MTQLKVVQQKLKQSKESVAELSDGTVILECVTAIIFMLLSPTANQGKRS